MNNAVCFTDKDISINDAIESLQMAIDGHETRTAIYNLAIQALKEKQERENPQALTLAELREMDGEPVWVVSQFLTIPTGWFLLHKNFYGKTIDLYGPIRVVCEDELLRCSTPLLIYRRPPENEAPPHD